MPFEPQGPCLHIVAQCTVNGTQNTYSDVLGIFERGIVSFYADELSCHVEVLRADENCVRFEIQAVRPHTFLYDGHIIDLTPQDAPYTCTFSHPFKDEQIRATVVWHASMRE